MTLSRANEELSIHLAGSEVKVQALTSRMEESEAKANELQVSFTVLSHSACIGLFRPAFYTPGLWFGLRI